MNANTTRRTARFFALPVVSAGIIAGALGFAGAASAGTYSQDTTPYSPGIVATPTHTAHSAPGTHHHGTHHHGIAHLQNLVPGYHP
ncbi:hypothetical protein [Mycobacterium sp. IDR2000157661]|uniref:hypothetical protein n=1 Tax=Mycobacterium sp. IDR2000157661 TaxID=2867005 RepID=UPI001EEE4204|nr:hypothetical protein [Mycobacterium sp. IDR2000157661]ULE34799.1 hypothetical protein K3G64_09560 [Mycobacterium sp. IDR2000157661]